MCCKKAKYFYSSDEVEIFKHLVKLLKVKRLRRRDRKCKIGYGSEIDDVPELNCNIRVELWESHDGCFGETRQLFLGSLSYPVCNFDPSSRSPGVPIRKSMKNYRINNGRYFKETMCVNRNYSYPHVILASLVEDSNNIPCICKKACYNKPVK